jgi:hypothetical protein
MNNFKQNEITVKLAILKLIVIEIKSEGFK